MLRTALVSTARVRGVIHPRKLIDANHKPKRVLDVFTDASLAKAARLKPGIGLGVYMHDEQLRCVKLFAKKPTDALKHPAQYDSNYGELLAILLGLCLPPLDAAISVHTDSETALDIIFGHRRLINSRYHVIARNITEALDFRTGSTSMSKVKGHSNVPGNVMADELAKLGALSALDALVPLVWHHARDLESLDGIRASARFEP